jgi:thiaminase/transcriptional activator TenA
MSPYSKPISFTSTLREKIRGVWEEAIRHRLFHEIATDTIDDAVYERYLKIEFGFVDTAARVLGLTVAKAPSFTERRVLAASLHDLTANQFDYFLGTFEQLGSPPEQRHPTYRPALAEDLHALFETTATHGRYEEILTCMLAAEWLYLEWCSEAHKTPSRRPYIADWVALHAGGNFARHVKWLREQLDRLAPRLDDSTRVQLAHLFKASLIAEIGFHTAAYKA